MCYSPLKLVRDMMIYINHWQPCRVVDRILSSCSLVVLSIAFLSKWMFLVSIFWSLHPKVSRIRTLSCSEHAKSVSNWILFSTAYKTTIMVALNRNAKYQFQLMPQFGILVSQLLELDTLCLCKLQTVFNVLLRKTTASNKQVT